MWCPCSKAYREAVAGGREPAAIPPRTPAEPSGGAPGAAGLDGHRGGAIPFTFEEVATAGIRTLERVPAAAKPQVSALFETVLRAATDDAGWLRAYAFAPLVLATTHRGGRKAVTEALRRRVRLWRAGQLDTLWAEARAVSAGKAERRARRRTYPVADDVDNRLELQTDVESVDDLDGATVRQVLRRARDRCYSRAVSALSAAQTAPADDATLAALMELHPPAPELPDDRSLRPVAVAKPSPGVIRRVLKKMPKGTAAGPSGLSAQHLLDLWDVSGSFKEAVADAVWALSSGRVAAAARPYLFGARLVPLVKKSGGIRPIACGEILRRVAGKVLASDRAIKDLGANVLLRSGQVGVSVKAGADAGVHAIRRVAALYRDRDVTDRGILQIDFANAFNMLRREAIIRSVNRHAPQLLGYALAAYEKHSALVVGDREISSECGVQQGDPLGPLLFSLALHDVVVPPSPEEQPPVPAALASSQVPADSASATPVRDSGQPEPAGAIGGQPTPPVPAQAPGSGDPAASPPPAGSSAARGAPEGALSQAELDLLTFFLDDGAAGGELDSLGRWLRDFEDRATAVGLRLNRGKCRLSVAPGATIPEALQGIETCPLDEIQHLGVPCGSPEKMRVFVEEAAKGAERKMRMIASLPDAHVALTLLKFCAGFVSVVHLMRAVGAVFDFAGIDQATQSCLATITGIETDASAWALASLPVRLGGLGLHSCADTAAIAHIAATFDGEACLSSLVTPYVLPHAMLLNEDDTFLASLEDPRLAPFDSVLEKIQDVLQARDNYGGRGQKVWSTTVHGERRKALLDSMTEELGRSGQLQGPALALKQVQIRARIQSCSGQHASAWLYGNAEADPRLWLSPAELAVAIRLRLGLPIAPMPSICRLCGTGSADVDGVHARSCFSGGRRTRMHNALRDVIADFARRGLLAPAVERPVFSNTERKRPDISYVRDGTTVVLDVAVTFPLQPSNPQYAKRAAEKPGGAATAYATAVKEGKYRGIIDNEPNPREWLAVPLVVDTFGAWVAALYRDRDVTDRGILQIDFANAFNMLRREAVIRSVNRHAPQLLGYALAAYEKHSALVVGDRGISSECGVQQGDPLGPLLFSLALHDVVVPPSPEEQPPVPAALASSQAPADSALATPARDSGQPEPPDAIGGQPTPSVPAQAPGSGDPAASPPPAGSSATRGAPEGALGQAELDLLTFFLDDGAAGGELDSLGRWLRDFEDRATAVGLSLNRGKCRLSVGPGATIPEALQGIETCPLDEIQHLGVPCGSPEKMRVFVEEAAKGAERKMRMIASLPDAHVALTLLKFCAGFVSVVHLMRAVGAVFDFAGIDLATQSCLATITGIETDASAWALASLPVRLGGLGLHSCADTAAIAHIAATFDGEACLSSLVTPYVLPHAMLLDEDDTFLASLEDPRLAPFDSVLEKIQDVLQARDNYGGRGQKVWSATAHDERRKALIDAMTEELGRSGQLQGSALALKQVQIRARIQSCSGQHASAWLYGNAEADPRLWLSPAELAVAIRLRLGLPIAPTPSICRLCGTGSADVDGVHARSCFSGGRRTRMHNALRDVIADFARRGLLAPAVERPVFSNTERKRPDISYVRDGTTVVLDVAVTFPLQPSNPQYAKRAAEKPGGAATAYATAVKEGKYRGIIDNEPNPREWLAVPLVVDTFGAWCPGALTELRQIARKSALREDRTASAACQDFFHQLSFQHASAWLYGNAEADPRLWLSPAELAVAIRLRLGLPIAPMPSICRLCGTGSADVDGVHARSCFSGGRRTRMHNALRDVIADFARRGLLAPAVERPVFSNTERKRPGQCET
ncbi:hypothetical protein DIPPA_35796 [Diplonema papillatum]|nr:hypothetical protein DIPPA_35796 [Diplonema papillatum]